MGTAIPSREPRTLSIDGSDALVATHSIDRVLDAAAPPSSRVLICTRHRSQGDNAKSPELRFANGTRVKCRVGADPITGWAPGQIKQLWYREEAWPAGTFAPYQVLLDDGRMIFAPRDEDAILRLNHDAAPGSGVWSRQSQRLIGANGPFLVWM